MGVGWGWGWGGCGMGLGRRDSGADSLMLQKGPAMLGSRHS